MVKFAKDRHEELIKDTIKSHLKVFDLRLDKDGFLFDNKTDLCLYESSRKLQILAFLEGVLCGRTTLKRN